MSFSRPIGDDEGDYLLFTGTLEPRKGVARSDRRVVERCRAPRPRLVLCGDAGWKTRIPQRPALEVTGYVTRERLRELYRGALRVRLSVALRGLRHPAARGDGLRRAGDRHAHRRDPGVRGRRGAARSSPAIVDALRAALVRILGDASLRRELRARGPERARALDVGSRRARDDGAAAMRVGIDARKIADFGIGTYIRGLLGGLVSLGSGDEYVAFAPAGAAIPDGVEHVVVDAPHYSVRELLVARPRRRSRAARRLSRAALRRPVHARAAGGHDPRPHSPPSADAESARAAVRADDDRAAP